MPAAQGQVCAAAAPSYELSDLLRSPRIVLPTRLANKYG